MEKNPDQPMPGGEAEIEAADPPAEAEQSTVQPLEAEGGAECKPGEEGGEGSEEEEGLGWGEPLNGEDGGEEGRGRLHPGVGHPPASKGVEELADGAATGEVVPGVAGAQRRVVPERARRARAFHRLGIPKEERRLQPQKKQGKRWSKEAAGLQKP